MNCLYCQQACAFPKEFVSSENTSLWACQNHEGEVLFVVNNITQRTVAIGMTASHQGQAYKIQLYYPDYFAPNAPDKPNNYFDIYTAKDDRLVLSLNRHPTNLTPENIKDKLPTFLIFL